MKNVQKIKQELRARRHNRVRIKVKGTPDKPRLSVYRSLNHIQAQLVDDTNSKTLLSGTDYKLTAGESKDMTRLVGIAHKVGKNIAKLAQEKGIKQVVFDKGHYKYHGRIKALAEGARKGGLKF